MAAASRMSPGVVVAIVGAPVEAAAGLGEGLAAGPRRGERTGCPSGSISGRRAARAPRRRFGCRCRARAADAGARRGRAPLGRGRLVEVAVGDQQQRAGAVLGRASSRISARSRASRRRLPWSRARSVDRAGSASRMVRLSSVTGAMTCGTEAKAISPSAGAVLHDQVLDLLAGAAERLGATSRSPWSGRCRAGSAGCRRVGRGARPRSSSAARPWREQQQPEPAQAKKRPQRSEVFSARVPLRCGSRCGSA
jgi:hypothetical protein